jgi:hypothetical protein
MVRRFLQKAELVLKRGKLLHLVERRKFARIAALALQHLLVEAQVVDQPAAADGAPEEFFLGGVRIDSEAVRFTQKHP